MVKRLLRLEKRLDEKRKLYVEFQPVSGNAVLRMWNEYPADGSPKCSALKQRENFGKPEDVKEYLDNMRAQYLKMGFAVVLEDDKPVAQPETPADALK